MDVLMPWASLPVCATLQAEQSSQQPMGRDRRRPCVMQKYTRANPVKVMVAASITAARLSDIFEH